MTVDRAAVRKQFAELLDTRLASIVQKVFPYQAGDLRGMSPVVIVTAAGSARGSFKTAIETKVRLEVHSFVLYSLRPVPSASAVSASATAIIPLSDTSLFSVGQTIYVEDENEAEFTVVDVVTPNTSLTAELTKSYSSPKVYIWTESQSEDLLDLIEYTISDEVRLANDDDVWLDIQMIDESVVDVVDLGGEAYRHETMYVSITLLDF